MKKLLKLYFDMLSKHSFTAALEMCALILDIQPGDEVIFFVHFCLNTNAFALRGATIKFADITIIGYLCHFS